MSKQNRFAAIPIGLLQSGKLSGSMLEVFAVIAAHQGQSKNAWPSQIFIAGQLGLCVRTVERAVRRLRDEEFLIVGSMPGLIGHRNCYSVRGRWKSNPTKLSDSNPTKLSDSKDSSILTEKNHMKTTTRVVVKKSLETEEIQAQAERHAVHLADISETRLDAVVMEPKFVDLLTVWHSCDIEKIIREYGRKARSTGMIEHWLPRICQTRSQKDNTQAAKEQQRVECRRKDAEKREKMLSPAAKKQTFRKFWSEHSKKAQ